jgi:hypothetical protein
MSFDFPFVRLVGDREFCYYLYLPLHEVEILADFFPNLIFSSISSYFTLIHITLFALLDSVT